MYLASRDPVVLNFNPFLAWKQDPRAPEQVCVVNFTPMFCACSSLELIVIVMARSSSQSWYVP